MCIRVLVHVNTEKSQAEMRHVYLREAVRLRPGFAESSVATEQASEMELAAQGGER